MKKSTFRQHRTEAQCDDTDPAGIFLRYRKRSLRDADAGTTDFRDRRCHGRGTDAESSHPSGVWFV